MQSIRNIAIIAHVDHGKTTLVDKIIHASKIFRENQEFGDLILDNNDLERERGVEMPNGPGCPAVNPGRSAVKRVCWMALPA